MRSVARIDITDSPDKLVSLPCESDPVRMGMHDELAEHYQAAPETFEPAASTLDYVVGAIGACLTGTFRRALAARDVRVSVGQLTAEAVGEIVVVGDVPIIRTVEVRYRLSGTDAAEKEKIERALAVHHKACAVSRSLESAIEINTLLELT